MDQQSNNKTIAKNTLFLYFRMLFTMLVSLFTSRVVLDILGVDDYGIYQTVGGVVAMLSFVNGALATGSSRFLTYELGTGNYEKLKRTFSSVLSVHVILALLIAIVAETVGLWFVYNKLVIPIDRMGPAVFAYHLSILASLFAITQVPYHASIISHEKMSVYAYASIVEVSAKLLIVYALAMSSIDKLVLYSLLYCLVHVGMALYYRIYCIRHFEETKYIFIWDKDILQGVLSYSGWNLFANTAIALNTQGTTILINMFFAPGVVAARAIANQVNMAANQFVQNFRTAANPQIVKKYASGDFEGSKKLLLSSTKFSYFMMLMLCFPICVVAEDLLSIWLKEVPEYTVVFLQLAIITSLFQVFDTSFYTALYAKGRIRENAMISPTIAFMAFPIIYILFANGYSPISLAWIMLIVYACIGLLVKPLLIIYLVDYTWKDILIVFLPCIKVTIAACPIPFIACYFRSEFPDIILVRFLFYASLCFICVLSSVWFFGLDDELKEKVKTIVKARLLKSKS